MIKKLMISLMLLALPFTAYGSDLVDVENQTYCITQNNIHYSATFTDRYVELYEGEKDFPDAICLYETIDNGLIVINCEGYKYMFLAYGDYLVYIDPDVVYFTKEASPSDEAVNE